MSINSFPNVVRHLNIANLEKELSRAQKNYNKANAYEKPFRGRALNFEKKRLNFKRIFDTIETPVFNSLGVNPSGSPGSLSIDTVYEKQRELYNTYPNCAKKYWESHEFGVVGMLGTHATPQSRISNYIRLFFETEKHCAFMNILAQREQQEGGKGKTRKGRKASKKSRKVKRS